MRANHFEISKFICNECGNAFPIPRPKSHRRKKNHVKDLWCPFCKKVVKTTEIKPNDYFVSMDKEIYYYRR